MDAAAREHIRRRAGGKCEYCRLPDWTDEWPFHVDHIVAQVHGGTGRATARLLDMNGHPQLELRRELIHQGEF